MKTDDILVIVDMQNDFITGSLANKRAEEIVPAIVKRINEFNGQAIIATQDTHFHDYLDTEEGKHLPVKHCLYGTSGWKLHPDIEEALTRAEVERHIKVERVMKYSFGYYNWKDVFEKLCIMPLEKPTFTYVGTCTGICVLSNATIIKSYFYESKHQVVESECACVTPESHKTAIEAMKLLQVDII